MAQESAFDRNIKHIVYVMMENRGFDNLLGWMYNGDANPAQVHNIPPTPEPSFYGLTEELCQKFAQPLVQKRKGSTKSLHPIQRGVQSNPVPNSTPILDPHETFTPVHAQLFNYGTSDTEPDMLGFLQDYYDAHPWFDKINGWKEILETYDFHQAPIINTLGYEYGVSDEWFCSIPSQTSINRAYSISGNSVGIMKEPKLGPVVLTGLVNNHQWNGPIDEDPAPFIHDTIWNVLSDHGFNTEQDWKIYYSDLYMDGWFFNKTSYTYLMFPRLQALLNPKAAETFEDPRYQQLKTFYDDAASGCLPRFSYLEPRYTWEASIGFGIHGTDYHPPTDIRGGESFLCDIYNALKASPCWENTLFIVAFDEHGGTFDHHAPTAKAINPYPEVHGECCFDFESFGVRVPMLFISPWVKQHSVIRATDAEHPFDHTSWLATLLDWFKIDRKFLGARTMAAPTFDAIIGDERRPDIVLPPVADTAPPEGLPDQAMTAELVNLATNMRMAMEPEADKMKIMKEIVQKFDSEAPLYADLREKMNKWVEKNT